MQAAGAARSGSGAPAAVRCGRGSVTRCVVDDSARRLLRRKLRPSRALDSIPGSFAWRLANARLILDQRGRVADVARELVLHFTALHV